MIPQEERWIFFPTNTHRNRFQPTLPQEERPFWCIMFTRTLSISIHAPTRGATAILAKKPFPFLAEINKLSFYILNFPLFHPLFFPHSTSFVHILRCESPDVFMYASYSHSCMITKSKYRLLQFLGRRPYVPPLSDTYFPDNRTSGCQRSHQ